MDEAWARTNAFFSRNPGTPFDWDTVHGYEVARIRAENAGSIVSADHHVVSRDAVTGAIEWSSGVTTYPIVEAEIGAYEYSPSVARTGVSSSLLAAGEHFSPTLSALASTPGLSSREFLQRQRFQSAVGPIDDAAIQARDYQRQRTLSRITFVQAASFAAPAAGVLRAFGASPDQAVAIGGEIGGTILLSARGNGLSPVPPAPRAPLQTLQGLSVRGEIPVLRALEARGATNRARASQPIVLTERGIAITPEVLASQGTSRQVGNFTGLQGATVEEIVSRIPNNWSLASQQKGFGIRFLDEVGVERVRLHGPSAIAPAGSNSASGWTLRIHAPGSKNSYYDNLGNVVGSKANEGHIPIYGNPMTGF
jgi:hypothetical protein